jgi:hypothetical protein
MERFCSTRLLKNAKFLKSSDVGFFPEEEPLEGFHTLLSASLLGRLDQIPQEEIEIERLAEALAKKRPPVAQAELAAPPFSGTMRFVQTTFNSSGTEVSVPASDLDVAIKYASLAVVPISEYCSQYGPNSLAVAQNTIPFNPSVTDGKYNDSILSGWVDQIAKAIRLGPDSCLVFLNPQGVVNTDADASQGVLGYHGMSSLGIPYAFVNVMGQGLTVEDQQDVYALALSHEIAEATVDPKADGSNVEVSDPCVPPGEIILGDNKAIEDYSIGDLVTGQSGIQGVSGTFVRPFDGELIEIKALGMLPFNVTPNHPIMVSEAKNRSLVPEYGKTSWKDAGLVVPKRRGFDGDYVVMPRLSGTINATQIDLSRCVEARIKSLESISSEVRHVHWRTNSSDDRHRHLQCPNCGRPTSENAKRCWDCFLRGRPRQAAEQRLLPKTFPLTIDTAWLLGLYVAEGYPNSPHRSVQLALSDKETEIAERALTVFRSIGLRPYIQRVQNEHGIQVIAGSNILVSFFAEVCGRGAQNKKIPDFILYNTDHTLLLSFLEGYMKGDGSSKRTGSGYMTSCFTTVSRTLALQLQLAFGRLGIFVSLRVERPAREGTILGRHVRMRETYSGVWCSDMRATRRKRLHNGAYYLPVKTITKTHYSGLVYNLETEDHTFLVSNAVTHNCAGNCGTDLRNYFDAKGNWISGAIVMGYAFFVDGIVMPANAAECPAPQGACTYPPPKPAKS